MKKLRPEAEISLSAPNRKSKFKEFDFGQGRLFLGDNLSVLSELKQHISNSVRLIYIDPPYATNQSFQMTDTRKSTISRVKNGKLAYHDTLVGEDFLAFLRVRLELMRELLAEDGSIYVHIGIQMSHHVRLLLDGIFGAENFRNEITRIKCNPKNFHRLGYGNIKDVILFYSKGKEPVWNPPYVVHNQLNNSRFNKIDELGRSYTTTPLHAPGETENGATGKAWQGMKPPVGRHWRYPPIELEKLNKMGLIEWSTTGNPRKKLYLDEVEAKGVFAQDVWESFIDPAYPKYPTEKNLDMLKLIIQTSSNPGDTVLDSFCGSGTTLYASQLLNRKWIGIDDSKEAIKICQTRLKELPK